MLHNRAIILAAGSSRRMGEPKMLLPYGESTVIETVIQNVMKSSVEGIVVVVGADHKEINRVITPYPVEICINPDHESGMLSSVRCGFRAMPGQTGAVLVFLGDQPGIPPRVTDRIIKAYKGSLHGIVIPVSNHRRGHPLLVDYKYKDEIEKLDLENGLRSLMHHFPEDVLEIELEEPGILVDIDTPEDYAKALKKYKS